MTLLAKEKEEILTREIVSWTLSVCLVVYLSSLLLLFSS